MRKILERCPSCGCDLEIIRLLIAELGFAVEDEATNRWREVLEKVDKGKSGDCLARRAYRRHRDVDGALGDRCRNVSFVGAGG